MISMNLDGALSALQGRHILTQDNFVAIASKPQSIFSDVLCALQEAGILNQTNFNDVLRHPVKDLWSLHWALCRLQEANILEQANFEGVVKHATPGMLALALVELQAIGVLNKETRPIVVESANPLKLADGLFALQEVGILNQANVNAVIHHGKRLEVAYDLCALQGHGILNQENFDAVVNHAKPSELSNALIILTTQADDLLEHIPELTENLEEILKHENPALIRRLVEAIPNHLRKNVLCKLVNPSECNQNHAVILGYSDQYCGRHHFLFNRDANRIARRHLIFPDLYERGKTGEDTIRAWQPFLK
jgi:hypothetical protein